MDKLLLTPGEVAAALAVSRSRAYVLISSGAIPSVRLGGKNVRVKVEDLRQWVERQSQNVQAEEVA
jgi:excisionase family DNA binding protein